ncbi:unnamed protein product, partial [Mesorhabditis belari]|uniref:U6 small nuclear RNA (adenine-(43)-N(6))-methyltransferase n=1 Tax=Mesorhabditis belari TaxID=2138241 RepID=A0AAF3E869_9BILA
MTSLNHLMHPRNPYKFAPPDFTQLAAAYPELRKHCIYKNNRVAINFRSDDAVRELTRAILHKDFGLNVSLPKGSLVPRVPQKLNYLLWVEDILLLNNIEDDVCAIDIGTGASCIYSLLGATLKKWKFIGSDVDKSSLKSASENVENNNLSSFISLFHVRKDDMLLDLVHENSEVQFTFCMCNPPFFEGTEADQRFQFSSTDGGYANNASSENVQGNDDRSNNKHGPPGRPNSKTVAKSNELSIEGGEVAFVNRIIDDSTWLQKSIKMFRFYTTMLGKKTSLSAISHRLSEIRDICFNFASLNQGKTKRWVVVWSYQQDLFIHDDTQNDNDFIFQLPGVFSSTKETSLGWIENQLKQRKIEIFHKGSHFLRCEAFRYTWNKSFLKREAYEQANAENIDSKFDDEPPTKRARTLMVDASVNVKLGSFEGKDSLTDHGNFVDCTRTQVQGSPEKANCEAWFPTELRPIVRFTVYQSPSSKTKFFFMFEEGAKDRLGHLVTFLHNTARQHLSKLA